MALKSRKSNLGKRSFELSETNIPLFLVASLTLIATPGQDNIYVITRGIAQGRRAAFVSSWGVCLGLLVHTILATVGLSAVLRQSAMAFSAVKYIGAAYLVYLGVRMILNKGSLTVSKEARIVPSLKAVFLQGMASNVLNPKVALFFLAFLPQFVSPGMGSTLQFLLLGCAFMVLTLIVTSLVAYFSGALGEWLNGKPGFANALQWLTGSILIGLGVRLALLGQK